jgi:hypothetical protein
MFPRLRELGQHTRQWYEGLARAKKRLLAIATSMAAILAAAAAMAEISGYTLRDLIGDDATSGEIPDRPDRGVDPLEGYITYDGSIPIAAQRCSGVLSLCLGDPIDAALDLLGEDYTMVEGASAGSVIRQWCVSEVEPAPLCKGVFVTIEADAIGAIGSIAASSCLNPEGPRVALPDGLILGDTQFRDLVALLGPPKEIDRNAAENSHFVDYLYRRGPEGTLTAPFGICAPYEVGDAELEGEVITSYKVH